MAIHEDIDVRISILFLIIAILLINTIVYVNFYELDPIFLILTGLMVGANVIAILLFKSHKIIAYLTGLFSFIFSLIFQFLIIGRILIWNDKLVLILTIVIVYFIFDEIRKK